MFFLGHLLSPQLQGETEALRRRRKELQTEMKLLDVQAKRALYLKRDIEA